MYKLFLFLDIISSNLARGEKIKTLISAPQRIDESFPIKVFIALIFIVRARAGIQQQCQFPFWFNKKTFLIFSLPSLASELLV